MSYLLVGVADETLEAREEGFECERRSFPSHLFLAVALCVGLGEWVGDIRR